MKKILFWLGVCIVSLLVMVRPAAASGTVTGTKTYWIVNMTYSGSTPTIAATVFIQSVWGIGYVFDHVTSYNTSADSWMGYKRSSGGTVSQIGVINSTVTSCPAHSTGTSTCTCDIFYTPDAGATSCVPDEICPSADLAGYLLTPTFNLNPTGNTLGCARHPGKTTGCRAVVMPLVSALGITLASQVTDFEMCSTVSGPVFTPPVIVDLTDPNVIKFQDVVAKAPLVDAAKTEQARADAYIAKVVADGIAAKIAADTAAAQAALDAQKQAVTEVKRAAGQVTASPTTTNVNNYNNAVTNYNNTVSVVSNAMTQLQNDYSVQAANGNNAQGSVTDATAIQAQIDALKTAITASGQPYDAPSVAAKTAGDTALNDQLTAAVAALTAAQAELAKASALATQAALDIAAAAKGLADTAEAIRRLLESLPGLPPPVPPTPPAPPPPGGPPTPYCVDHPTDPACKVPEPVDCSVTPNAPGCLSMSGTPEVRTLALSGVYVAGTLNEGKTVGDVLGTFKTRMLSSGVVGAATNFFNVTASAGACPTWSVETPMFGTLTFNMYCTSTFQNLLPWIRSVIMLIFSVVAFRIAIL